MRIAMVSGAIANKPFNGGNAWTRLSWVLGLERLGFQVYFVEQIARAACVDTTGEPASWQECANRDYFKQVTQSFGLTDATLLCENGDETFGLSRAQLVEVAASADLLINISGHLSIEEIKSRVRCKVYFDDDPGYTQFWSAMGSGGARLGGHDFYYTVGANIGDAHCPIPTGGLEWRPLRPLAVLDEWPVAKSESDRFTTVGSWRGAYGAVEFDGVRYGVKAHEFRKFIDIPQRTQRCFEVALDIHPGDRADLESLHAHGWRVVNPIEVAGMPEAFRRYVQTSGAEYSVAQGIYVQTASGWFSDRTVHYLASGKPALVQDTGLSTHYPVGQGLVTFRTIEEAMVGVERILEEYQSHCRAARALAEEYFDSNVVLPRLLREVGVS
jgi:hypothetical protein